MPPRTILGAAAAAALLLTGCATSRDWHRERTADGQTVWTSQSGKWTAQVEPARGRLTYLGTTGGRNLLLRPDPPSDKTQFGGHRAWLGPQKEWPKGWPPPKHWESEAAGGIHEKADGTLVVDGRRGADGLPAIRREYRWIAPGVLETTVSWKETDPRGRQAIQILQVDTSAVVTAERLPTASAPLGFVQLPISGRPGTRTQFSIPPHAKVDGRKVYLRSARTAEKVGFPVQTLVAKWKDAEIHLHPLGQVGRAVGEPDGPFSTQVYLGSAKFPLVEIEQLSPRLVPTEPGARVGHSMLIELRRR